MVRGCEQSFWQDVAFAGEAPENLKDVGVSRSAPARWSRYRAALAGDSGCNSPAWPVMRVAASWAVWMQSGMPMPR
jgi:hypothetical protein